MPYAAFDLETAKILPDGCTNLLDYAPLGIACAAVAMEGRPVQYWEGVPQMNQAQARALVQALQALTQAGYTLVTWNGCGFDFRVLAEESGLWADCGQLALQHIDLMLIVTYTKGYRLPLETALRGAGLAGKLAEVTLSNGATAPGGGAAAPQLWARGECAAVRAYLHQDVQQLLALVHQVNREGCLRWVSQKGSPVRVPMRPIPTVAQCAAIPLPDTSWMAAPPSRDDFVGWIPGYSRTTPPRR